MKKAMVLTVSLLIVTLLPAQGIYQLWGLTRSGGTEGNGVIYSTDALGNNFKVRHNFGTGTEGRNPLCKLTSLNGKLYGTAGAGGNSDAGVIFEWDPSANVYTKKIDFNGIDGLDPRGFLTFVGSKFYGVTFGGGINQKGVIFEWDPATNIFSKKFDFDGINGANPFDGLTQSGNKLYGTTSLGGIFQDFFNGIIFEWDPVTNVFTKKYDFGADYRDGYVPLSALTKYGEKFYGITIAGGIDGTGVIFEWDPVTNVYTKKIDFSDFGEPLSGPKGDLALYGGKFYGLTPAGKSHGLGEIFEWDPATNIYTVKLRFDSANGYDASGSLTLSGGKFYSTLIHGGINDKGVIFEWDPSTNAYIKKKDLDEADGQFSQDLTLAPAPVAKGAAGSCVSFTAVTIDASNNNQWVPITDDEGNAVAEIKANGNNLGLVNASMYINNGTVREDVTGRLYLDRNITLTSQVQPSSAVNIRLYIKGSEFLALKNSVNSNGSSSGVGTINSVVIYKKDTFCSAVIPVLTDTIASLGEAWGADYVFTASTTSFASFYFGNRDEGSNGPLIRCHNDTVVNAVTGHCGVVVFYKTPVITGACEDVVIIQRSGLPSGAFFPVGTTTNTFIATCPSGQKDSCNFTITVKDNKPPFISQVQAYPSILWPPNHKMRNVRVNYFVRDNCEPVSCSLDVSSNEPVDGTGYRDRSPDWVITDKHHIKLRAERSVRGDGRVYTITVTCKDASGNASTQKTKVFVPLNLHGHYFQGAYSDQEDEGYADDNGNYFDAFLDCRVLPNPSKQNFTLEINSVSNEKIEVNVFDIAGRLISKPGIVKNKTLRFGDSLRPGIYLVEVRQGQYAKIIR